MIYIGLMIVIRMQRRSFIQCIAKRSKEVEVVGARAFTTTWVLIWGALSWVGRVALITR